MQLCQQRVLRGKLIIELHQDLRRTVKNVVLLRHLAFEGQNLLCAFLFTFHLLVVHLHETCSQCTHLFRKLVDLRFVISAHVLELLFVFKLDFFKFLCALYLRLLDLGF